MLGARGSHPARALALALSLTGALALAGCAGSPFAEPGSPDDAPAAPGAPATSGDWPAGDSATVDRVIDGDTVDVLLDGAEVRVRLLNVDTPETVKDDTPVQCLGPEASAFLEGLLGPGDTVTLEYDVERTDQYGRTLAAVVTADGRNASVELAANGLAESVLFEPNDRFLAEVERAEDAARSAGLGLHDPNACAY